MSAQDESGRKVVPAQLNFLAIFSPLLGTREDNQHDQIVFYHSRAVHERRRRRSKESATADEVKKIGNDQLRQIGLAQGMLNFARGFSGDAPLDSIETEKHRIVLTELEREWWILASIDLTRLPSSKHGLPSNIAYEYSSREISPSGLLIQQLLRAYRTFLLHHSHTLSDLYVRLSRDRFCEVLEVYWTSFALQWDVLLHGNPAVDMYGGIKLAAGGELGIGVGEEEWGSGEREVLEGLIRNTEGMLDLTVSRFGLGEAKSTADDEGKHTWLGRGSPAAPTDGVIFSGVGVLARPALRNISRWIEDVYVFGEDAYGIRTNPSATRRRGRRKRPPAAYRTVDEEPAEAPSDQERPKAQQAAALSEKTEPSPVVNPETTPKVKPSIPPPIVSGVESSLESATKSVDKADRRKGKDPETAGYSLSNTFGSGDVWTKYLTLGYGSAWGASKPEPTAVPSNGAKDESKHKAADELSKAESSYLKLANDVAVHSDQIAATTQNGQKRNEQFETQTKPSGGRFIVGLAGDLDASDEQRDAASGAVGHEEEDLPDAGWSDRLSIRTLYVSISEEIRGSSPDSQDEPDNADSVTPTLNTRTPLRSNARLAKVRAIIYAHEPFIYTLVFEPTCPLLTYPSFFHDLHHHLTPLHGSLSRSTNPSSIAASLASTLPRPQPDWKGALSPILDFVYSPNNITVRSNIPNIPAPGTAAAEGIVPTTATILGEANAWTRVEALSVHSRILDTILETRADKDRSAHNVKRGERERTLKTSRGWWIVWLRAGTMSSDESSAAQGADLAESVTSIHSSHIERGHTQEVRGRKDEEYKEAFLIRRSADASSAGGRNASYRAASNSAGAAGWMQGMGSSALAPFSRLAGGVHQSRRASAGGVAGDSGNEAGTIGGIGVDARRYVEGLLSLNR